MSTNTTPVALQPAPHRWGCFLAFGILLLGTGILALAFIPVDAFGTVFVLGWLMVATGVFEALYAPCVRGWGGTPIYILGAVLGIPAGLLAAIHPVGGVMVWTLWLAAYFTGIGIFHVLAAVQLRHHSRGWPMVDAVVTLALGLMLWALWPDSAIWFLGFAFGFFLMLRGCAMVMFAFAVRIVHINASDRHSRLTRIRFRPGFVKRERIPGTPEPTTVGLVTPI